MDSRFPRAIRGSGCWRADACGKRLPADSVRNRDALGGILGQSRYTSFFAAVLAGSVGSFAGAMLWYYLARWIGKDRLSRLIDGHGAWLTITPRELDRVDDWFNRWGPFAVLGCRLIPGVRTFINIPAGFSDMPVGKFSFLTAIGTVAWTALLAGVGWWLGDNYGDLAGPLGWVSSIVVAGLFLWWLVRVIQQRLSRQPSSQVGGQD